MKKKTWIVENFETYFWNASSKRDMRSQLRGTKSVMLFLGYLCALGLIVSLSYSSATGNVESLASMQRALIGQFDFFKWIILGALIIAAPAMGAASVISERQRQALDLVFSAPVKPKYYFVGKLISSTRLVLMMLTLSIPFVSVLVLLGGATWGEVFLMFYAYALIGIALSALGILFGSLSKSMLQALFFSFVSLVVVGSFEFAILATAATSGGRDIGLLAYASPIPFLTPDPMFEKYRLTGTILFTCLIALICRMTLLGASISLLPTSKKEIIGLRIITLIIGLSFSLAVVYYMPSVATLKGTSAFGLSRSSTILLCVSAASSWMFFLIPRLSAYSRLSWRRYENDGRFNVKELLTGAPSGALPFLLAFYLVVSLPFCIKFGSELKYAETIALLMIPAFYTFYWALCRTLSAFLDLKAARAGAFTVISLIGVAPSFLGIQTTDLRDLTGDAFGQRVLTYGVIFIVLSVILLIVESGKNREGENNVLATAA